ncbi:hypothetical protein DLAC_07783 [Tieghemostelium lacteum]|uniref:ARID domain-containing protein n=1 Tax=Tieghemostelium lacteum TaxID=361077 RepID=A0A151ZAF4_TIELA|nr:hypothetical protein DLAC_07783 [Tieghemostelium lacteum]|eukprot:KYQ90910.1 hypothetical protein DLAC_07783 [Tieghemostelium lacteum]
MKDVTSTETDISEKNIKSNSTSCNIEENKVDSRNSTNTDHTTTTTGVNGDDSSKTIPNSNEKPMESIVMENVNSNNLKKQVEKDIVMRNIEKENIKKEEKSESVRKQEIINDQEQEMLEKEFRDTVKTVVGKTSGKYITFPNKTFKSYLALYNDVIGKGGFSKLTTAEWASLAEKYNIKQGSKIRAMYRDSLEEYEKVFINKSGRSVENRIMSHIDPRDVKLDKVGNILSKYNLGQSKRKEEQPINSSMVNGNHQSNSIGNTTDNTNSDKPKHEIQYNQFVDNELIKCKSLLLFSKPLFIKDLKKRALEISTTKPKEEEPPTKKIKENTSKTTKTTKIETISKKSPVTSPKIITSTLVPANSKSTSNTPSSLSSSTPSTKVNGTSNTTTKSTTTTTTTATKKPSDVKQQQPPPQPTGTTTKPQVGAKAPPSTNPNKTPTISVFDSFKHFTYNPMVKETNVSTIKDADLDKRLSEIEKIRTHILNIIQEINREKKLIANQKGVTSSITTNAPTSNNTPDSKK